MASQNPASQDGAVLPSAGGSHDFETKPLTPSKPELTTNDTLHAKPQMSNGLNHTGPTQMNGHAVSLADNSMDELSSYIFPVSKLSTFMQDPSKTPLLLVACGSFSPITYLHLRMFEMVADYVRFKTEFEIVGGYLSPVSDAYKKKGLASAKDRSVTPQAWLVIRVC